MVRPFSRISDSISVGPTALKQRWLKSLVELVSDGSANAEMLAKKNIWLHHVVWNVIYTKVVVGVWRANISTGLLRQSCPFQLTVPNRAGGLQDLCQDDVRMTLRDCLPSLLKGKCDLPLPRTGVNILLFFLLLTKQCKSSQKEDFSPGKEGVWKMIGHSWNHVCRIPSLVYVRYQFPLSSKGCPVNEGNGEILKCQ